MFKNPSTFKYTPSYLFQQDCLSAGEVVRLGWRGYVTNKLHLTCQPQRGFLECCVEKDSEAALRFNGNEDWLISMFTLSRAQMFVCLHLPFLLVIRALTEELKTLWSWGSHSLPSASVSWSIKSRWWWYFPYRVMVKIKSSEVCKTALGTIMHYTNMM